MKTSVKLHPISQLPILLMVGLFVLGCSLADQATTELGASTPASPALPTILAQSSPVLRPTAIVSPIASPAAGDSLNLPFPRGNPPTFDPAMAGDTSSTEVIFEIFSGLTTIDRNLKIQPDIAESWTLNDDHTIYTFKLRTDAKFQDGRAITAQDFKYSFERIADPKTASPVAESHLAAIVGLSDKVRGRAGDVRGVKVIDEHTLQITIDAPKAYFLAQLATPAAFVVDKTNVERGGPGWFLKPNGSGPYKLVRFDYNQRIVLESNALYYLSPKPAVKNITLWMPGGSSYVDLYDGGLIDSALANVADFDLILSPRYPSRRELSILPAFRLEYIGLNTQLPPFDDLKVRQAFAMAIDKKSMAEDILLKSATPAVGIYPPGFPGYDPQLKGLSFDPQRARQLIGESKYGDVKKLPQITLTINGPSLVTNAVVAMIKQNLGIEIVMQQQPFALFLQQLNLRPTPYQMYSLGRVPEYADPVHLESPFYGQSLDNHTGYANPLVDKLLEQGRVEPDEKKRLALYQQAEQLIVNDTVWIPLLFGDNYWLTKPYVKDLLYPPMVIPRLRYVSVTR